MNSIRHYIFLLVGLVVLFFVIGLSATLWVASLILLCFGVRGMGSLFSSLRLIDAASYTSLALAVGSCIFLFIHSGWIASVGFIVLFVGAVMLQETTYEKWERLVVKLRTVLQGNIPLRTTGKITQGQLEERFFSTLRQQLFTEVYTSKTLIQLLLSKESLSDSEYKSYLEMLEKSLAALDVRYPISDLRMEVRKRLGLAPYNIEDFKRELAESKRREGLKHLS